MTAGSRNLVLVQALAFARHGWPVFPCQPGQKTPATQHGFRDASTDPGQITRWFAPYPDRNLAIATGAPGPDVLDVDVHPSGDGYATLSALTGAGLVSGAAFLVRTPGDGAHLYFTGSGQRNGRLPACHLDFRAAGGYVLAPPSRVGGKPYVLAARLGGRSGLDWAAVTSLLEPARSQRPITRPDPSAELDQLARWVARLEEGNRNAGLYWAACRALETSPGASLDQLAAAAAQAGLGDREIRATLKSARNTTAPRQAGRCRQAETR